MEVFNLKDNPIPATMIGFGDKVFYKDEKGNIIPAEVSMPTELRFGTEPEYTIKFLADYENYKIGDQITTNRDSLYINIESALKAAEGFHILAD